MFWIVVESSPCDESNGMSVRYTICTSEEAADKIALNEEYHFCDIYAPMTAEEVRTWFTEDLGLPTR